MNGNKAVLDSNIIDASKGLISIIDVVKKYDLLFLSIISYIEVLGYNFSNENEKTIIEDIFNKIPIINLDIEIATIAIGYRKSKKIRLPDAVILATANYAGASLITRNTDDFLNVDNSVEIIKPKIIK
jgi:predicted nucleic acid-binding protein